MVEVLVEEVLGLVSLELRNLPAISINGSSLSDESSTVTEAVAAAVVDSVVVVVVVAGVATLRCVVLRLETVLRCFSAFVTAAAATAAFRGFLVRLGMIRSSLTHD